jgi:renalase
VRIVVVGAGLAGLSAGQLLHSAGHEVVIFDKGRSPGGRCATRRIAGATLDHGAQFFTVRDDEFAECVSQWTAAGVTREWTRGFANDDGHPRYIGSQGMTGIAKHLAQDLNVTCSTLVFAIERGSSTRWRVRLDDGTGIDADAVVLTCPVPQSFALAVTADIDIPEPLRTMKYDATLAALVVTDRPIRLPEPGAVQRPGGIFEFIADNQRKGISNVPAVTFHATAQFSNDNWWLAPDEAHRLIMDAAAEWIGDATIVEAQHKRWRMATPQTTWPERLWAHDRLVFGGDAFGGPRIEGAVLSGRAAARHLLAQ